MEHFLQRSTVLFLLGALAAASQITYELEQSVNEKDGPVHSNEAGKHVGSLPAQPLVHFQRPYYTVETTKPKTPAPSILPIKLKLKEIISNVTYSISNDHQHPDFIIDRFNGDLYLQHKTIAGSYKLYICANVGDQPCMASTMVRVRVKDEIPQSPLLASLDYNFVLPLNFSTGDVFSLGVQPGVPDDCTFELGEGTVGVSVDPDSGMVTIVDDTWHGNEMNVTLKFVAKPPSGSVIGIDTVIYRVERGPYSPIFTNSPAPLYIYIPGAIVDDATWVRPATSIYTLHAVDAAVYNAHVVYKLEAGGDGQFSLDCVTGEVKTSGREPFPHSVSHELAFSTSIIGMVHHETVTPTQVVTTVSGDLSPQFDQEEYVIDMDEYDEASKPTDNNPLTEIKVTSFYDLDITLSIQLDTDPELEEVEAPFTISSPTKNGQVTTGLLLPTENSMSLLTNPRQYRFKVVASENGSGFTSIVQIIVNLIDINDHEPFFLSSFYTRYNVYENTSIGTTVFTVSAIDRDEGDNAILDFTIENEDFDIIQIDNYTAEIVVTQELDSSNQRGRRYEFAIRATDRGLPPLTGGATVHIRMINSNNKSPVFEPRNQEAYIREELAKGELVHVVQAYDPDGDISPFTFKLTSEHPLFDLDETTGQITLKRKFESDGDKRETFVLEVELDDGINPATVDNVTIFTMGINRPPRFTTCVGLSEIAEVEEDQPGDTRVITLTATDPDSGPSGEMEFTMYGTNEEDKAFKINNIPGTGTAELVTKVVFDRENPESVKIDKDNDIFYKYEMIGPVVKYLVTVKVEDKNPTAPLSSLCSFLVTILDINDHKPMFEVNEDELDDYAPKIPMNPGVGVPLFRAYGFDRDEVGNNEVVYECENINCEGCMEIDENGYIMAMKNLEDVLAADALDVIVQVKITDEPSSINPPGTGSTYQNFTLTRSSRPPITWGEINGNDLDNYELIVKENVIGIIEDPVLSVDSPEPTWFVEQGRYTENNKGLVFGEKLEEEEICDEGWTCGRLSKTKIHPLYPLRHIRLVASIGKDAVAIKYVPIKFDGVNLWKPKFGGKDSLKDISAFVSTETVHGDPVAEIFAYDTDSGSPYNVVRYMFEDTCDVCKQRFTLVAETGEIKANDEFHDDTDDITLLVYARDNPEVEHECGDNEYVDCFRRTETQKITINIAAPLSETPMFVEDDSSVTVDEGFYPPSKDVVKVNITYNGQETGQVKYSIVSGNDGRVFAVNPKGLIYQVGELDYTAKKWYSLLVGVFFGGPSDETSVTVNVREKPCIKLHTFSDVDDLPYFVSDQKITEHQDTTTLVADIGPAGDGLRYELVGPLMYGFKLEGDEVHISGPLDRDFPNGYSDWQVNVEAVCDGRTEDDPRTFAQISLKLVDINDNSPVFDTRSLSGSVKEGLSTQTEVMQVVAVDYDEGRNAEILYHLMDIDDNFQIHWETGVIKTKKEFDREVQDSYKITVQAKNNEDLPPAVQQYVWIHIEDVDDHPPIFQAKEYHVSVAENQPRGSSVVAVYAEDLDIGDNARRDYTVLSQDSDHFYIDSIRSTGQGVLKINQMIDYDVMGADKTMKVNIKVSGPKPSDEDEAVVFITVTDMNDNAPIMCPGEHLPDPCPLTPPDACVSNRTVTVPEDSPIDHLIDEVAGCDADSGNNGLFHYYIDYEETDPEKKFKIEHVKLEKNNGQVRLRKTLDRETQSQYLLHILAIDKGEPSLTGTSSLIIVVGDVNDNAPQFDDPDTWRVVRKNTQVNVQVGMWKIIDRDDEDNGPPFTVNIIDTDDKSKAFNENFDWNYDQSSQTIKVLTKKALYERTASLKRYTAYFNLEDRHGLGAERELNVEIEDVNDHGHTSGTKDVTVYSYKGLSTNMWLGHVYVKDVDDWDRTEKTYKFTENVAGFSLDPPWDLKMTLGVNPTSHTLRVTVADDHTTAVAVINVHLTFIYNEALNNTGSLRLQGISPEGLVESGGAISKLNTLRAAIAQSVGASSTERVQVLNIRNYPHPSIPTTDVYYAVTNSKSQYFRTARLDGKVWTDKAKIEASLDSKNQIKIVMAPINDCHMLKCWEGSCANQVIISQSGTDNDLTVKSNTVNTNMTAHVGIDIMHQAQCQCDRTSFPPVTERCSDNICLNGGTCEETWANVICTCPEGFEGPRCQQMKMSFNKGVAWYQPLSPCHQDVIRFQFATKHTGEKQVLLYNGPVHVSDRDIHLAVQLEETGVPWFSVNMGSGEMCEALPGALNDGTWHTIEIIKEGRKFRLVVDYCKSSVLVDNGQKEDRSNCELLLDLPGDDFIFAPTGPLQLGGRITNVTLPGLGVHGLVGCIKNVFHKGQYYDLHVGDVGYGVNILAGCPEESSTPDTYNTALYSTNQTCEGDLNDAKPVCRCLPRKTAPDCADETIIRDYKTTDAFLAWNMKDGASDNKEDYLQVSFRTRQSQARIFYAQSETTLERMFLEIENVILSFTYDLGRGDSSLSLPGVNVSDGIWHTAYISRHGTRVILQLDAGEGRFYNELEAKDSLPNLSLSGKNYIGGANVEYRRFHAFPTVTNSMTESQLTDLRLSPTLYPDARLALTTAENSESAGELVDDTTSKVSIGPVPNKPCDKNCRHDQVCVDAWRHFYCSCLPNQTDENTGNCEYLNDCTVIDCGQGGQCVTQVDRTGTCYYAPPDSFSVGASLAPEALGIIISCLILMLLLLLLSTLVKKKKQPEGNLYQDLELENHIRENIMPYYEEGPGEELPVKSDLPAMLRLPLRDGDEAQTITRDMDVMQGAPAPQGYSMGSPTDLSPYPPDVIGLIMKNKEDVDEDPACNASDYLLNFEEEGSELSLATSLSSLQSSDTGDQNYDYLFNFGPRFQKLADLYGESDASLSSDEQGRGSSDDSSVGDQQVPFSGTQRSRLPATGSQPSHVSAMSGHRDSYEPPYYEQSQQGPGGYSNQYSPESSVFSEANVPGHTQGFTPSVNQGLAFTPSANGYENAAFSDPRYDEAGYGGIVLGDLEGPDGETLIKPRVDTMALASQDDQGLDRTRYGSGTFIPSTHPETTVRFSGLRDTDISDV